MNEVVVNAIRVATARFPSAEAAAVHELLRQRAVFLGLVSDGGEAPQVEEALERLLEAEAAGASPSEEECRRYYDAHPEEFTSGELVFARHILFQVTPGVSVPALRAKAELALADLMRDAGQFAVVARECSNCPSARDGGSLGQLSRGDTVAEFERALFNGAYVGVYPQLVRTRYGFHVLAVDRREAGRLVPYEAVRDRIVGLLSERSQRDTLARYVSRLAARARIDGADFTSGGQQTAHAGDQFPGI